MIFLNLANGVPARRAGLRLAATALLVAASHGAAVACPVPEVVGIAAGVFAIQGSADPEPARSNCGRNANAGAIVAAGGLIAIDPGPNRRAGAQLRRALRAHARGQVAALVNTHAHPENVLGNGAWRGDRVAILASDRAAALMRERCRRCVRSLRRSVGAGAMRGTRIVLPNRAAWRSDETIVAGRRLRLLRFEHAHTPGDLAVLDLESGVLFAGGLANAGVIPDLHDASLAGWLAALDELEQLAAARIVPGHGDVVRTDALVETRGYLGALRDAVKREIAAGADLPSALERLDLPPFQYLAGYARRHPLNVQHAWAELEQVAFER